MRGTRGGLGPLLKGGQIYPRTFRAVCEPSIGLGQSISRSKMIPLLPRKLTVWSVKDGADGKSRHTWGILERPMESEVSSRRDLWILDLILGWIWRECVVHLGFSKLFWSVGPTDDDVEWARSFATMRPAVNEKLSARAMRGKW